MKLGIQSIALIALLVGVVAAVGCAPKPDGTYDSRDYGGD